MEALHPGIPPWIDEDVRAWIDDVADDRYLRFNRYEVAAAWDRVTRNKEPLAPKTRQAFLGRLVREQGDDYTINFIGFLLHLFDTTRTNYHVPTITSLLDLGGSEWRVMQRADAYVLEKRVDDTVQQLAEAAISEAESAGALLAEAWHAMYGRSPDHEEAYEKAIKAVEEAASPVVSPDNKRATLGSIVRDMKAQGDWAFPIADPPGAANRATAVAMAETLWFGQESRHGGNGYRKPSPSEAETAVTLAVALVHAFTQSLVARR